MSSGLERRKSTREGRKGHLFFVRVRNGGYRPKFKKELCRGILKKNVSLSFQENKGKNQEISC